MSKIKDFFSLRKNAFFWINIAAMILVVVGAIFGALSWVDSYTRHGKAVTVPSVEGTSVSTARIKLEKTDLRAVVIDSAYNKKLPAGVVLDQKPAHGKRVKKGRMVYLTINTDHAPRVAVPDIMENSSLRQAEAKLRAIGFKLNDPEFISGERDWVYKILLNGRELEAGEKIPAESRLTIVAGDGTSDELYEDSTAVDEPVVDEDWF